LRRGVLRKNRPKHFAGNRSSKKTASNTLREAVLQKKQLQTNCGKPFFKKNSFKQIAGRCSSKKTASIKLREGVLQKKQLQTLCGWVIFERTASNTLRRGVLRKYSSKQIAARCSSAELF
jgi:hypothetical protein